MNLSIAAVLLMGINAGLQSPWPNEHPSLDRAEMSAAMRSFGDHRVYQSSSVVIDLYEGTQLDDFLDQAWSCLPPASALQALRLESTPVWKSSIVRGPNGFHLWRSYAVGTRGPSHELYVDLRGLPDAESAAVRLSEFGKGVVAVRVPRVTVSGLDIGDQVQKVLRSQGSCLEFRLGRFVAQVTVTGMDAEAGDRVAEDAARALEFRIWASGLMGDRNREFVLSNGMKLRGLATTNGYVPLSEIARLGATVDSVDDPVRRRASMRKGSNTVRADEYLREIRVNGQPVAAPPAIPYKGDLWVPVRAVVEALGFTITG